MDIQPGLCQTWSKTGFLMMRLKYSPYDLHTVRMKSIYVFITLCLSIVKHKRNAQSKLLCLRVSKENASLLSALETKTEELRKITAQKMGKLFRFTYKLSVSILCHLLYCAITLTSTCVITPMQYTVVLMPFKMTYIG